MKKLRILCALFLCATVILLSSCQSVGGFNSGSKVLKIGVFGIEGKFNPFYAESEADINVISQMFSPIQRQGKNNSLVNHAGGISYEFVGDSKVKYTVSIRDDLFFSDGTNIKIDDVIFFYHFIADASYDGIYKDWYINDIAGIKEYYFDDKNYAEKINSIEIAVSEKYSPENISSDDLAVYLEATSVNGLFTGNLDDIRSNGESWKTAIEKSSFASELASLDKKAEASDILSLVAEFESQNNASSYDAREWYRNQMMKTYIDKNYSDGTDVSYISGIKKINDYTCTVLFNSKNINAVSELNAFLVPKSFFANEYIKGSADKVKDIRTVPVSSGPYALVEQDDNEVLMTANEFYFDFDSDFKKLRFIDLKAEKKDPVEAVSDGKVDVVTVQAEQNVITAIADKPVIYQLDDCNYYTTMFFNSKTIENSLARKALMGICNVNEIAESRIGTYYTRLFRPMSIRFAEYPSSNDTSFYNDSAFSAYQSYSDSKLTKVTAYYSGDDTDIEYAVLEKFKENLSAVGIILEIKLTDDAGLDSAIISGQADIWIENVYDGSTCDKYDYYHSNGTLNRTGLNNAEVDMLCRNIRTAVGFEDKKELTDSLLNLVMEQAVEYPLYQRQMITLYNTETISSDSLKYINQFGGYTYLIPYLKCV